MLDRINASNDGAHFDVPVGFREILFDLDRIGNAPFWVVSKADQAAALRVCLVPSDVFDELVTEFLGAKARSRLLQFKHDSFTWKKEIHPSATTGVAGSRLFRPHVIEKHTQHGMHEILDVVLVSNVE